MKNALRLVLALMMVCGVSSCGDHQPAKEAAKHGPADNIVSFYEVIARPEAFDGMRIQIQGYLSITKDGAVASLYPNFDSLRNDVVADSVSVVLAPEQRAESAKLDKRFVLVVGSFTRTEEVFDYIGVGKLHPVIRLLDMSSD